MAAKNTVKITLLTPYSDYAENSEFEMEFKEGDTFKDLLDKMVNELKPGFKKQLYNKNGEFTEDLAVLRNGRNILGMEDKGLSIPLQINDEFVFLTILEMG